jgi:hypothetical protein
MRATPSATGASGHAKRQPRFVEHNGAIRPIGSRPFIDQYTALKVTTPVQRPVRYTAIDRTSCSAVGTERMTAGAWGAGIGLHRVECPFPPNPPACRWRNPFRQQPSNDLPLPGLLAKTGWLAHPTDITAAALTASLFYMIYDCELPFVRKDSWSRHIITGERQWPKDHRGRRPHLEWRAVFFSA